jgi:hypothetical protein
MTNSINKLIGLKVKAGSPGYHEEETIKSVFLSDAYEEPRFIIEFESGFSTNIAETDLEFLIARGEAVYTRYFRSKHDRAVEIMSLSPTMAFGN